MTVLIVLKDGEDFYLGSDRQSTCGDLKEKKIESKFFKKTVQIVDEYNKPVSETEIYIGVTGYSFIGSFIRYNFKMPDMNESIMDPLEYLNPAMFKLSKKLNEYNLVDKNNEQIDSESRLLLVFDRRVFEVQSNFSTIEEDLSSVNYVTAGSGDEIALGSLYTSEGLDWSPKKRIKKAIRACDKHTIYVDDNIDIIKI